MVFKPVLIAMVCTTLLMWSAPSMADQYRPDEFLGMDLSRAALSPKPLGPPEAFAMVPAQAKAALDRAQARTPPEPKTTSTIVMPKSRVAESREEYPRGAARTRLARRHSNPLDAEAFDTRIQVWPCKSGGICNWKR